MKFNKGDIVTGAPGKGGHGKLFTFDCYDASAGDGCDAWIIASGKTQRERCITMGMVHYDPNLSTSAKIKLDIDKAFMQNKGPHNCADHLVFCQGFRFDYHFCKVCGTKQNVA